MSLTVELADRVRKLPPYLFVEIDRLKNIVIASGKDVIDLGIGDPDIPTPQVIVDALIRGAQKAPNHRYPSSEGMLSFRAAVASWFVKRFGVTLDPEKEIISLIGSKEGIGHMPLAFVNPGDCVLLPDPCYPAAKSGVLFAGGVPYVMPLLKQNQFLPDLSAIPSDVARRAKMMYINYPNNPTAAVATRAFFEEVVKFATTYNIIVCHDAAYSEVAFDGYRAPSFFEVKGAKEVGIEFHSLSKTFCMTGWRIGFAVGNPQLIAGLAKIKSNLDSGAFQAIQEAAIAALNDGFPFAQEIYATFEKRRTIFTEGLRQMGISYEKPKATFYVWLDTPKPFTSAEFAKLLLEKVALVLTPGTGFGDCGEGYVRAAMTVSEDRIKEALARIQQVL